jgi:hypothetical protein
MDSQSSVGRIRTYILEPGDKLYSGQTCSSILTGACPPTMTFPKHLPDALIRTPLLIT